MQDNVGSVSPLRNLPLATREDRRAYLDASGGELPRRDPGAARWLVEPVVGPLIDRLSKGKLGWCNATERSLRVMTWLDTGHLYGDRSIARWIGRTTRQKRLLHKRIPPGAHFHQTGKWSKKGTQLNRWPSEAERRERLWRSRIERRKARQAKAADGQKKKQVRDDRERQERAEARQRERALERLTTSSATTEEIGASCAQALAHLDAAAACGATVPDMRTHIDAEIQRARAWAEAEGVMWDPGEPEPDRDDGA